MSSFAQARADLTSAMDKLAALDRVFGMMEEYAGLLAGIGQHPELGYDAAAGRLTLSVAVGRVPPRVAIAVEDAVPAPDPDPKVEPVPKEKAASATRLAQFRTGPWTDAELMTAAAMIREGRTNREIAARLNRTATGIHFKLDPLRAELAQDEGDSIPGETEGVTTADDPTHTHGGTDGSHGSRQPQADADVTRADEQAPEAEEKTPVAAGGSPAPDIEAEVPSVVANEDCGDGSREQEEPPRPSRAPSAAGLTLAERRIWELLDEVRDARWPAARDLDMLARMMRGDGATATAEGLGLEKPAVVSRWRRLFPEGVTMERQARLVRVLQARIAAEVAA